VLIEMTQKTARKEQSLEDGDVSFTHFLGCLEAAGKNISGKQLNHINEGQGKCIIK